MAIGIGDKPDSDFKDPIGLLEDCHRRIEKFLDALVKVATRAQCNALNEEERSAVETALQYFRHAAPKHTADEEESLFPRMRATKHLEANQILFELDHLHLEHTVADENHRAVDDLFRQWITDGVLPDSDFNRLTSLLHLLRNRYARHIREEETRIFPWAAKNLPTSDLKRVGLEMARRRGLPFHAV